ncbi:MAG TPA: hypothetical protein VHM00_04335 [Caldimonas sp.]|nr:hypothetical protein [Caldimonas sp.]HEX2540292.1 hypothetical protein [Caldimonas sp.]
MPAARTLSFHPFAAALLLAAGAAGCTAIIAPGRALSDADFNALQPGMTREQVLARVGPPTWTFGVRQENLTIWNYRWDRASCLIHQVSVRPDGTVRDVGTSPDPACDGPNARD